MARSLKAFKLFAFTAALTLAAATVGAETLQFSLPQARSVAMQAATQGRPDVALTLTQQLLDKNPNDSAAHLARGTAFLTQRAWSSAFKGGRLAFRHADSQAEKFQAARITALAAIGGDQNLVAQYWLRRAGDLAETEVDRTKITNQFRVIRARTPLHFRFDASVMPSSNVNGGSESAYNIIDGVPLVGILSADAQALSGFVGQSNIRARYRLGAGETHSTSVDAGFYTKRVVLSEEAKAAAPAFDAASLGVTSLDFGVRHARSLGSNRTTIGGRIGARAYWQGGDLSFTALKGSADIAHSFTPKLRFSGNIGIETRQYNSGGEGQIRSANVSLSYRFQNGNRLTGSISANESDTPNVTFDSQAASAKITYSLAQPVWSMLLSAGVGMSYTDYANYSLGFIPVPGGRQDEALFMDLDATFSSIEFAGFSPNLRLRRTETESNVSRYDTSEWAVSVGIRSNF